MLYSPVRGIRFLMGVGFFLLLVVGCGRDGMEEASEWTVEEGALTLERNLLAGDDETYFFGEIADLAARGDGRIYVADGEASHVKVLGPQGGLRDSIGREGEGPGEFNFPPERIGLARGDSIYVQEILRVSVFAPDHSFTRRFPLPREVGSPRQFLVPDQSAGYVALSPVVIVPSDPELHRRPVVHYRAAGRADTLFSVPPPGTHIQEEDVVRPVPIPFTPGAHLALGPEGRLHYGWGDELSVVRYTLDGRQRDSVDIPFKPVPVSPEEREQQLSDIDTGPTKTALAQKIPATKSAFTQFLVDDEGRYWFGRPTAHPDTTDWWVAWPEEKRVATGTLPSDMELEVVTDGRAYGRSTTEGGAPVVVRYDVNVGR